MHSIFAYGMQQEWCDRNPVDAIEAPRVKEMPIEPLSLEEVQRQERAAERPELREMQLSLKLMLYCGIRPTEVTRINQQCDIIGDELIIRPNTRSNISDLQQEMGHSSPRLLHSRYITPIPYKTARDFWK